MIRTALLISLCALTGAITAQTYTVDAAGNGADFTSIQEAIDFSWHGDAIIVNPGVYMEDLYYNSRAILITGTDPDDPAVVAATILKGSVTFDFTEGPDSIFTGFTVTAANPDSTVEIPVSTAVGSQRQPAVWADTVVWADERNIATSGCDIYGTNLSSNEEFVICAAAGDQVNPAIQGSMVVWQDARDGNYDIYAKNLETGIEIAVCTAAGDQQEPAVYGDLVVWKDNRSGSNDIYAKNIATAEEFAVCTATNDQFHPAVYEDLIVWADARTTNNIWGRYVGGSEFVICSATNSQEFPAVYGDIVVWQDYRSGSHYDVYGKNLTLNQEFVICNLAGNQTAPAVFGDCVIWADSRAGASNTNIYSKNLVSGEELQVCMAAGNQLYPAMYEGTIVWQDEYAGAANMDIYGCLPLRTRGALECYNATPLITKNVISGFAYGILSLFEAKPLVLANTIRNNYYGVAGNADVTGNLISFNYGSGILNCTGSVQSNQIRRNLSGGVADCNEVMIYQNEICANSQFGLSGCLGTFYENTIGDNEGDGLVYCTGTIRENAISGNTDSGVDLCAGEIYGNSIVNNAVGVSSCDADVYNNTIGSSGADGIEGGSGEVFSNMIRQNAACGVADFEGIVKNNTIAGNLGDGVSNCTSVVNNTIAENKGHAVYNCTGQVKNNILACNGGKGIYGPAENSYNCLWDNEAGSFYNNFAKIGDVYGNPLFSQPGNWADEVWTQGDYSLRSQYGRWDASLAQWVIDAETSLCIDRGDPADGIQNEPNPNGGRINMGGDGGTSVASKASTMGPDPADPPIIPPVCIDKPQMDANDDCRINLVDLAAFASAWLDCGYAHPEDC